MLACTWQEEGGAEEDRGSVRQGCFLSFASSLPASFSFSVKWNNSNYLKTGFRGGNEEIKHRTLGGHPGLVMKEGRGRNCEGQMNKAIRHGVVSHICNSRRLRVAQGRPGRDG